MRINQSINQSSKQSIQQAMYIICINVLQYMVNFTSTEIPALIIERCGGDTATIGARFLSAFDEESRAQLAKANL